MLTGSLELFHDQNVEFVKRATGHGVDVTHEVAVDQVHVYPLLVDVSPVARASLTLMADFMRKHTSGG